MPHSKQAAKRVRQSQDRRLTNRSARSALRTAVKKFKQAADQGDVEAASSAFRTVQQEADRNARKGIVPKGRMDRVKSRLASTLEKLRQEKAG